MKGKKGLQGPPPVILFDRETGRKLRLKSVTIEFAIVLSPRPAPRGEQPESNLSSVRIGAGGSGVPRGVDFLSLT